MPSVGGRRSDIRPVARSATLLPSPVMLLLHMSTCKRCRLPTGKAIHLNVLPSAEFFK
jgi:hypothetical protein